MKRIDQWLANLGYCSRSEAKCWVGDDRVKIISPAGPIPIDDPGARCAAASLLVDGEPLDHPDGLLLMMHKPLGYACSHDPREAPLVYDLLPPRWRSRNPPITSIGRLDRDTSGLLLLTDQSPLVHRLTSPKHKVPKTYQATFEQPVPLARQQEITELLESGTLVLEGESTPCLPAKITWHLSEVGAAGASLVLTEGRYHQVRRMFASQGHPLVTLYRTTFGALILPESIIPGKFVELPLSQSFI